jgi:L-ribulose-5-phosphate 4-epimerase
MDEGYIKFNCILEKINIEISANLLDDLNRYRTKLVNMNMIGKIQDGPGFGNISAKKNDSAFYISSTNTGHLKQLKSGQVSLVTKVNIAQNTVWSMGLLAASSESMSHAVIYKICPEVNSVIHIHHKGLWKTYKTKLPTTHSSVPYGTPEMTLEITRLLHENKECRLLILGGHEDGIIAFGDNMQEAFMEIDKLFQFYG